MKTIFVKAESDGILRVACPGTNCGKVLKIRSTQGGYVTCPRSECRERFEVRPTPELKSREPNLPEPNTSDSHPCQPVPLKVLKPRFVGEPKRSSASVDPVPPPAAPPKLLDSSPVAAPSDRVSLPRSVLIGGGIALGVTALLTLLLIVVLISRELSRSPANTAVDLAQANSTESSIEIDPGRPASSQESPESSSHQPVGSGPNEVAQEEQGDSATDSPSSNSPANDSPTNNSATVIRPSPAVATPVSPNVNMSRLEIATALRGGLSLAGSLQSTMKSDSQGFDSVATYHNWYADLQLLNSSNLPIEFSGEILLYEKSADNSNLDGFAVLNSDTELVSPTSYGLMNNFEQSGQLINRGNGITITRFLGGESVSSLTVAAKDQTKIERDFPQYSWILEPTRVYVVLPSIRVATATGTERFGYYAIFESSGTQERWNLKEQHFTSLEAAELSRWLSDSKTDLPLRVAAANWLAEVEPMEAKRSLVAAVGDEREGHVLGAALSLLARLKGPGLEVIALSLLQDSELPNGIRGLSAEYLGALKYQPSLKSLLSATSDSDPTIVTSAIWGLGDFGGSEAITKLVSLMNDESLYDERYNAAMSLARSSDPKAFEKLRDEALKGNYNAISAIASSNKPETFELLETLAESALAPEVRDEVARGLFQSGGERALPILLKMLESPEFYIESFSYGNGISESLGSLNSEEAIPSLLALAERGNRVAANALAGSTSDSATDALLKLASDEDSPVRLTVLNALLSHESSEVDAIFASAFESSDPQIVEVAISRMQTHADADSLDRLLPLLKHPNDQIRQSATWVVETMPIGDKTADLANVMIKSSDSAVISMCARKLLEEDWEGGHLITDIGRKLSQVDEYQRYDLIKLVRKLSDNEMGPSTDDEWYADPEGWFQKWMQWINRQ